MDPCDGSGVGPNQVITAVPSGAKSDEHTHIGQENPPPADELVRSERRWACQDAATRGTEVVHEVRLIVPAQLRLDAQCFDAE